MKRKRRFNKTEIKRVVAYARVSDPRQAEKDLSIPAQLDAIRKYCAERGYELVKEFIEPGASGRDDNRKVFRRMMDFVLAPSGNVDAIIVVWTSRFIRNAMQARVLKDTLRKRGVRVYVTPSCVTNGSRTDFDNCLLRLGTVFSLLGLGNKRGPRPGSPRARPSLDTRTRPAAGAAGAIYFKNLGLHGAATWTPPRRRARPCPLRTACRGCRFSARVALRLEDGVHEPGETVALEARHDELGDLVTRKLFEIRVFGRLIVGWRWRLHHRRHGLGLPAIGAHGGESLRPDVSVDGRSHDYIERRVMMLLAGGLAEKIHLGRMDRVGVGFDHQQATDLLGHVSPEPRQLTAHIKYLDLRMENILVREWNRHAVEVLALYLVEHKKVKGSEAKRIQEAQEGAAK